MHKLYYLVFTPVEGNFKDKEVVYGVAPRRYWSKVEAETRCADLNCGRGRIANMDVPVELIGTYHVQERNAISVAGSEEWFFDETGDPASAISDELEHAATIHDATEAAQDEVVTDYVAKPFEALPEKVLPTPSEVEQ